MKMYFEKQRCGRCRYHTVANFLNRRVEEKEFEKCAKNFEFLYCLPDVVSAGFTATAVTRETFVAFCIRKLGKFGFLHLPNRSEIIKLLEFGLLQNLGGLICYDAGHVFCIKKHDNQFFNKNSTNSSPRVVADIRNFVKKTNFKLIFVFYKKPIQKLFNSLKKMYLDENIDARTRLTLLANAALLKLTYSKNEKKRTVFAKAIKNFSALPMNSNARILISNFKNFI